MWYRERERESYGTGILFEEPNPTGSRPRGLIGLYKRWHQEERPQPAKRSNREEGGGDRGSTAARPTLTRYGGKKQNPTRDWGGPQVRDPVPIISVNPEADPPQPRAPVRPRQGEQDGETAEEKSQSTKNTSKGVGVAVGRSGEKASTRSEASAGASRDGNANGRREYRRQD